MIWFGPPPPLSRLQKRRPGRFTRPDAATSASLSPWEPAAASAAAAREPPDAGGGRCAARAQTLSSIAGSPRVNGAPTFTNMDPRDVKALLRAVRDGGVTPEDAAERLKSLPYEDLG